MKIESLETPPCTSRAFRHGIFMEMFPPNNQWPQQFCMLVEITTPDIEAEHIRHIEDTMARQFIKWSTL